MNVFSGLNRPACDLKISKGLFLPRSGLLPRSALLYILPVILLVLLVDTIPFTAFFSNNVNFGAAIAQELTPEMLDEAVRRTGLSRAELQKRYNQGQSGADQASSAGSAENQQPGRSSLDGVDDRIAPPTTRFIDSDEKLVLPFDTELAEAAQNFKNADDLDLAGQDPADTYFGHNFFNLDAGLFNPPSFGPVSADYRLGVGDEIIVNIWGDLEQQLKRIVDRDGTIILPQAGKISCAARTLSQVDSAIRRKLAETHSSIKTENRNGSSESAAEVEVILGKLRAIRVFVIGATERPGSYELSSVSTILTALYASGGPAATGSMRNIRLIRGDQTVAELDLYDYLLGGDRSNDAQLQEGDTVFLPDIGPSVKLQGNVKRPMFYEMKPGEELPELFRFAGGFNARAAADIIHIHRILPPGQRQAGQPDVVYLDVNFDPVKMIPAGNQNSTLLDGDKVIVDAIEDRSDNWIRIVGQVKRPGLYQYHAGMTAADLIRFAGGLWKEALLERAVVDRTAGDGKLSSFDFALGKSLNGQVAPVELQALDVLHIFKRWDLYGQYEVSISGQVNDPVSLEYREGMTLRDLVLRAGGLKRSANMLRAEISRLHIDALSSHDLESRPEKTVEVLQIELGDNFLTSENSVLLEPSDRVSITKLPWWESQKTIQIRGEVFYPGVFSLERQDETISSVIARAGGLKPDAYLQGARIFREQDNVGNIAIDLAAAMDNPGSAQDIVLQSSDVLMIPDKMFTIKVVGEVGFPTSLVYERGKDIDYYVHRAGGYLENADKDKTRVILPNGMSFPNQGNKNILAGSTIVVPIEPPPEGPTKLQTLKEITAILAGLATVWLVIDRSTQ